MAKTYDLVVIGTGVAGSSVATKCRKEGWGVAIIDRRPFGGTCSQRGCDPKKVLVHAAHLLQEAQHLEGKGLAWHDLRIDWPALMRFKRTFTADIPENTREKFAKAGIDAFHGSACFIGAHRLEVDGQTLEAEHVLIAAGAEPMPLDIDGEEHLFHSGDFLELEALPEKIVFVGGGYISMEFAHLAARAGVRVQVLETTERPLQNFEADLVEVLLKAARALGIEVCVRHQVKAIEEQDGCYTVVAEAEGSEKRYEADLVVHGAGRVPPLGDLNLKAAGIDCADGHLALNEFLQSTSNPAVYAAGDAAQQGKPLTPVASIDAQAVTQNLLNGNTARPDYTATPTVVYTTPRMASVGLTEEEAREEGRDVEISAGDASGWFTPRHRNAPRAAYKVLIEKGSRKILGAHLVYPKAEEIINLFAVAMRHGLTADDLKSALYAYPSSASDVQSML